MSSEKRRRARVQGGWASSSPPVPKAASSQNAELHVQQSVVTQPPLQQLPSKLSETLLGDLQPARFVFKEPEQKIREIPQIRLIDKAGEYILSTESDSVSRIRLYPNFYEADDCEWMFEQLRAELPWIQRSDVRSGVSYLQPRLTAWFADHPYSYSGVRLEPNPNWSPLLTAIKDRLEETTGLWFNSMLANLYRDGHDSVDWHSDDEPSLRDRPVIASLTFGDTRMFELRKKPLPEEYGDFTYMEHVKIPLDAGTLLVMDGTMQSAWQHRIPKEYHHRDARINLTFRVIYPE